MIWKVGMPNLGHTMEVGLVQEWTKDIGAAVERGECLALVESDKVSVEVEAPAPGLLLDILVDAGESVPVGATLALIGKKDEAEEARAVARDLRDGEGDGPSRQASASAEPAQAERLDRATAVKDRGLVAGRGGQRRRRASPLALRLAKRHDVDVEAVSGTGPKGLVVKADVTAAAAEPRQARRPQREDRGMMPRAGLRARIAERMAQSWREAPMVTLTRTLDVSAALGAPRSLAEGLRINDLILAATARALARHRRLNAWMTAAGPEQRSDVDLAFAVALDDGLITPVIAGADELDIGDLSRRARDLAKRARSGKLQTADVADASFTVSNLGGLGIDTFSPILNPPQVGILGVGRVRPEPTLSERGVEFRPSVALSLVFDHRALDGADGARFLETMAGLLAEPRTLLHREACP